MLYDKAPASFGLDPFKPHWELYPKTYVARRTSEPLLDTLDGDLTKDAWTTVPWSDYFDDIRGDRDAPPDDRPNSNCKTRFKALWDHEHLYIGALIETNFETVAEFKERNSPIFQKDSDFEVFIDPIGSCHNYKELELNAINTVWNLMLDKPYNDNGHEHSGRVARPGDPDYYEVYHQKTAVKLLRGKLNTPGKGTTWSLEIAISYKDIMAHIDENPAPPAIGQMWRINFSRVENKGDTNWTWQPQIVWNPDKRRNEGLVQMHLPDAWGYLVFGSSSDDHEEVKDASWPVRLAAMNVYYAQSAYHRINQRYASNLQQLGDLVDWSIISPFKTRLVMDGEQKYTALVGGSPDGNMASVTQERYLQIIDDDLLESQRSDA